MTATQDSRTQKKRLGQIIRACLDAMVPLRSPIQIILFLPFQNERKPIFTAETVAQRNSPIFAKQALRRKYVTGQNYTSVVL